MSDGSYKTQAVNMGEQAGMFISSKTLNIIKWSLWVLVIIILISSGIFLFLKQPSRNDISLIIISVLDVLCIIISLVQLIISFIRSNKKLLKAFAAILTAFVCVSVFIILYPYYSKPTFVEWVPLSPMKKPIDIEKEPSIFPDNSADYSNENIYPFLINKNDNSVEAILNKSNSIFDFFEKSGLLDKDNHENDTFSLAKSAVLDSPKSIIPELDNKTFGDVLKTANNDYIELKKQYYDYVSKGITPEISIDDVIAKYGTMIDNLNKAKEWSIDYAGGVNLDLIALISRNYKERAYAYAYRNDSGDNAAAIDDYIKSIEEYALLYRICKREHLESKISYYNILYWIATIYHNMGDIQRDGNIIRIAEFTTADAFFSKQVELKTDSYFESYSRYYSAMASHKMYIMVKAKDPNNLPRELKYYLQDAFANYLKSKDNDKLSQKERNHARDALPAIAECCLEYLYQYPDEENGDVMKSIQYYK